MSGVGATARAVEFLASDGYRLRGYAWQAQPDRSGKAPPPGGAQKVARPVVIVNAATSVRCRYYARFADYLSENGCDVVAYDYRGIGVSRHGPLKHLAATWFDWGVLDFEAVLAWVAAEFPGQPVCVAAHSFGGCATGLARSAPDIARIFTVGAQFAHWRDYAVAHRKRMFVRWHIVMPAIAKLFGYFPGKRLGWLEDTPFGVVKDWSSSTPRLEDRPGAANLSFTSSLNRVTAPILAISISDDPFGTIAAVDRLLRYFRASRRTLAQITPASIGEPEIGHFGFFHDRYRATLWPIALAWLRDGKLSLPADGRVVSESEGVMG